MDGDRLLTVLGIVLVLGVVGAAVFVGALIVNPPENPHDAPDADWRVDRINETSVRIVHAGGKPIPAEELLVTVDGNRRAFAASGRIATGDGLVVPAARGSNVELYWTGGRGGPVLLTRWGLEPSRTPGS